MVDNKEALVAAYSKKMVEEVLKYIAKRASNHGDDFARPLMGHFIAAFVGTVVYKSLSDKPKKSVSKEETYQFVMANYEDTKIDITDAVAAGFQGAMFTFSGKQMDYYCTVKPVPEPSNKMPC